MRKIEKVPLDEIDTKGFQLSGYVKATNKVRVLILNELGAIPYVVYETILSHKNTESITAYPSIDLIARECGISKRTVEEALKKLVNSDYLLINSGRPGVSNNYYFVQEPFMEGHENDMEVQLARRKYKGNQWEDGNKVKRKSPITKKKNPKTP